MLDETPSERLKRKVLTDNLWFYILKLLIKQPRYGFEIRAEIAKRFGLFVGNVTAYKVLYDLESQGYAKAEKQFYKRRYMITPKGRVELKRANKFLRSLVK